MSHSKRTFGALVALIGVAAFPLLAADDSRFSLAIGSHENLLISGPGGQSIADVSGQTVGQNITVGTTTLQVSYGRDANGQLTAILTSPDQDSVALHFSAGGKSIDAEKAVVTLTFSPNLKGVLVDPGYVGTVEVDSHVLRARSLADDLPIPAAVATAPSDVVMPNLPPSTATETAPAVPTPNASSETASATPDQSTTPATAPDASVAQTMPAPAPSGENTSSPDATPAPGSVSLAENAAKPETSPTAGGDLSSAPVPLASQLAPILPPLSNSAANTPASPTDYRSVQQRLVDTIPPIAPGETQVQKLYWSEPVTAPDGSAPAVATNEIRLVEVHGTVTITAPDGTEQTGSEGMPVPSGGTVRTADNSSAALFMGGVNSARLMPSCELVVTQTLSGPLRTDVINLKSGAVFSRIGHRDGETESYSVVTPEGTTAGEANDMMAYRGTPDDLRANPITSAKLNLDVTHLLAWDPAPAHGLISDVPGWDLGSVEPSKKTNPNTYFYYCQSGGAVQSDDVRHEILTNDDKDRDKDDRDKGWGKDGNKDRDNHHHDECQPQFVLQQILETLQPYNCKLKQVLTSIDNGTASHAEVEFYHKLISVFFCIQVPGIVNQFEDDKKKFDKNFDAYNKVLTQDLNEFGLPCLTPH